MELHTVHTVNIICQRHYFVAHCVSSYVCTFFRLYSICFFFFYPQKAQIRPDYSVPVLRILKGITTSNLGSQKLAYKINIRKVPT